MIEHIVSFNLLVKNFMMMKHKLKPIKILMIFH